MTKTRREHAPVSGHIQSVATAYEVVAHIVDSNPSIEALTLVKYQERPNWRDIFASEKINKLPSLLEAVQQDRGRRIMARMQRRKISAESLRAISRTLRRHQLLAVVSKVRLTGSGTGHIPMMDFACDISSRNQEILTTLLGEVRTGRGFLLESGRSYHYYGVDLLSDEEWRVFLGKCLLMCGYVDDRYIGHQLVDGHCVLRLSAGELKAGAPRVVAEL